MATATTTKPRFKALYDDTLRAQIQQTLELPNVMQVPRLEKIVINMGVGGAVAQANLLDAAVGGCRTTCTRATA